LSRLASYRTAIFEFFAGSPPTLYFVKRLNEDCPKCGGSVLEKLIRNLQGGETPHLCSKCRGLFLLSKSLRPLTKRFDIGGDKATLKIELIFESRYELPSLIKGAKAISKGIAKFGLVKPLITSVPLSIVLEMTRLCNSNCPYCYAEKANSPTTGGIDDEMVTEDWLRCLDIFYDAGVVSITFSGGEALLRKDFFLVLDHASRKGFSISLATNGALIDRLAAKRLKASGVEYVEISLHSPKNEENDACRGIGSFEKSLNAVRFCREEGMSTGLSLTLVKQLKDEVDDFFELARSAGADILVFMNFVPSGSASASKELDLFPGEREAVLKRIAEKRELYEKFFKRIVVLQAPHLARILYDMTEDRSKFKLNQIGFSKFDNSNISWENYIGGCAAGRFIAAIGPNGDIFPCPFLRVKLGNIKESNFLDVWISSPVLEKMRDRRNWKGNCGECRHKIVCGGCRARAYAYCGDFLGQDPGCALNSEY
jgi:radical SAM protein with 4Fe4S-binding SPASM domain